jgi:ATP-binding cassette, subfamily B, multidrug efflux pump
VSAGKQPGEGARRGIDSILEEESLGKAVDRRLLARLWPFIAPYRAQVAATILLVFPMFVLELIPAWLVKTGLDHVILEKPGAAGTDLGGILAPPPGWSALPWLGALFLATVLLHGALTYVHTVLMATTGQAAMRDLRAAVFRHIESLHLGFFDSYPVGRLVTRATNDVENVAEMFTQGLVSLVTDLFKMAGFAIALFLVEPTLALAAFAVVPFLLLASVLFRLKVREAFRTTRVLLARINAWIQETVTGMKVVQLFTREERNLRDFAHLNAEHRDAWKMSIYYDAALFSTVEFASGITVAIVLWWGSGIATPGVLYLFIQWMRRFFMPLSDLSAKYSVMQSSMASVERIFQLMDTEPAIRDPEPARASRGPAPGAVRGEVVFEDVWFSYQGEAAREEDWVLRGVSLRVASGEKTAFVGATGAGKTTIIKLLTRLYEVTRGRILLDGVDLRDLPQRELRRRVAMVLQDVFLFSGTIAENVALGRADIDAQAVERAARAVEAHLFVAALPEGYGTPIRERGTNLSAGQRQLLSFARALAHGADVLVLDEATSSIDTETEAFVQRGIHTLMEGKTALVIAHRLSTIEDVDRIHVLHHGRIVESGTHTELLAAGGVYAHLHALQTEEHAA